MDDVVQLPNLVSIYRVYFYTAILYRETFGLEWLNYNLFWGNTPNFSENCIEG